MKKQIKQVALFHTTYGQPLLKKPALPSMERMMLRYELLREELQEFKDAIEAGDLVEAADALIDMDYIQKGSLLEFGLADCAEDLFDEVQRSNMSKLDENGNVVRREDGKILKSALFSAPDLKSIIEKYQNAEPIDFSPLDEKWENSTILDGLIHNPPVEFNGDIRVEQIRNFEGEVLKVINKDSPSNEI